VPKQPRRQPKPAIVGKATPVLQVDRQRHPQALGPVARVGAVQSISPPFALKFFLKLMVGLSLLAAVLGLAPRRALPQPILDVVGAQRELLVFVSVALAAAAGLVLLVFVVAVL
jgi:hypothetical protein